MSMKEAYVEKIQARLNQWDSEIENLKSKAAEASADAKVEYERQIDELKGMQKETQAKLDELRAASDDAWTDLKAGVENAWDSLERASHKVVERFAA